MTDRLTETDVQTFFDQDGRHPGCYSIELQTPPDDDLAVIDQWFEKFAVEPPGGLPFKFANAHRLCYVGSHGQSVYERLLQHAKGHKSSTIMELWPPVAIDGVLRSDTPKGMEYTYAVDRASRDGTVVWRDGQIHD